MKASDMMWALKTPPEFKGKHPDWYWVKVTIPMTRKEMLKMFGPACTENRKECACCKAWKSWRKTGRATIVVKRTDLL